MAAVADVAAVAVVAVVAAVGVVADVAGSNPFFPEKKTLKLEAKV